MARLLSRRFRSNRKKVSKNVQDTSKTLSVTLEEASKQEEACAENVPTLGWGHADFPTRLRKIGGKRKEGRRQARSANEHVGVEPVSSIVRSIDVPTPDDRVNLGASK